MKYAPKWMVSSLIFQKISGEGLTEPPPQTPPPAFSRGEAREKALVAEAPLQTPLESLRCSPNPLIVGFEKKLRSGGCFYDSGGVPPWPRGDRRPCEERLNIYGLWRTFEHLWFMKNVWTSMVYEERLNIYGLQRTFEHSLVSPSGVARAEGPAGTAIAGGPRGWRDTPGSSSCRNPLARGSNNKVVCDGARKSSLRY